MGKIDILQLQCELQTAQADFNKWAGDLMDSIEDLQSAHADSLKDGEKEFNQLREEKISLDEKSKVLKQKHFHEDAKCQALQQELENVQSGESVLPGTLTSLRSQVQDLSSALKRETEAAELSRSRHDAKLATLQKAAGFYKQYLGLEFRQGSADGELQVLFTCVDPSDPARSFSFTVQVTNSGKYNVGHFQPEELRCSEQVERLNATGDFSRFVKAFREACKAHCSAAEKH